MSKQFISSGDKLKRFKLPVGILLIGIITMAILIIAKPKPEPAPIASESPKVKVSVTPAKPQTVRLAVTAHGTVSPRREIDLIAQVSGQIIRVEPVFLDGGFFAKSQVLIQIDDRDYKAALLNAKALLAEAARVLAEEEGRSRVAKREWSDLGNKKANDLFIRKPHLFAAKAKLASAEGDVARAELNLERTQITVPFDGRIKQTYADLGQYVTVGKRVATVYDSKVVEVRLPLTEKQASLINLPLTQTTAGNESVDAGSTRVDLPTVTITGSVAGETHQWLGVLTRTDAFVDSDSRMYYAVVEVHDPFNSQSTDNNAKAPLIPGLFVEAEISGKEMNNVLVLPRSALYKRDKIISLDANNSILNQTVKVLRKTDSQVWIQAVLAENTLIALEKQSFTPEGAIVEPLLANTEPTAIASAEPVKE